MIKFLLYKPVLLFRKIILFILILTLVLGIAIYFVANSPLVIKRLADTFAPDYNITYSRIYGNGISGIEIDNLAYNDKQLAKRINLRWNPAGLLNQSIIINKIELESIDIANIELFVASLENNDTNKSQSDKKDDNKSNPYIPTEVIVDNLFIDIMPYSYEPLDVSYLKLKIDNALFDIPTLVLKSAKLDINASSNLTDMIYETKVEDNKLIGGVLLTPQSELFCKYELPLRPESIDNIYIDLNITSSKILASLNINIDRLLVASKDEFNLDIDRLSSFVTYDINHSTLTVNTKAKVTTPYAKDIELTNIFEMDKNISYSGKIYAPKILGVDSKYIQSADNLYIDYAGDTRKVDTNISSDNLIGTINLPNFQNAIVNLSTKKPIYLNTIVSLPTELNQTKVNIKIDAPISFKKDAKIKAHAEITSNLVNIDANVTYKDKISIDSMITIPPKSLLRDYQKEPNWDNIAPLKADVTLLNQDLSIKLKSSQIDANIKYDINTTNINSLVNIGKLKIDIIGSTKDNIHIQTDIKSLESLLNSTKDIYDIGKPPPIKGKANIKVDISKLKNIDISIKSPQIIYKTGRKTKEIIKDIDLKLNIEESNIILKQYSLKYKKQKIFANNISTILTIDDIIQIQSLWLNDQLKISGEYNKKTKKGDIDILSDKLDISHKLVDFTSKVELKTILDNNKTSIKGDITVLKGKLYYNLDKKRFASDSDIIIVQDIKKSKPSPFMDNLSIDIKIKSKNPIIYKRKNINMRAKADISVHKSEYSDLMFLGYVELMRGGSYIFQDKRFVLNKSHIYFTGNLSKPVLDISIKYKALNHTITIRVTGSADNPTIKFSSSPNLSEAEILSVILFDTELGAENNSGTEMMMMMGGAVAKSALSNLGIKLDHLILGEGNSIEVGKKISNRVTIIYVNDIVSSVKVKYRHNRNTDSIIEMKQESQSYDIVFKKDF